MSLQIIQSIKSIVALNEDEENAFANILTTKQFKKKEFFSAQDKEQIVEAIRMAEKETSGEIRIYVESKNPLVSTMDRAGEVFYNLKMDKTDNRNAVLLYMATKHKEIALFADEGIFKACGTDYWNSIVKNIIIDFKKEDIVTGVEKCIQSIGEALKEKFPYDNVSDKNELPDNIIFGK